MIKLIRLELHNFLSHVDTDLHLSSHDGLVLIEGRSTDGHYSSNGAGKSTLLEGIVYALTGDTLRGVGVNDVVNRNYKKNTKVSLTFLKDDIEYQVVRYRKDDKLGDSLVLMKNGEDISKRVNKETQKQLEDILGISYNILVSTILLGEGLSSRFTQLSDPEKKSLIESTLNLNCDMNKIRDKANSKLKEYKLESAKVEGEIKTLEGLREVNIEMLENSISDNESCIKIYEETSAHIDTEISKLNKQIDDINPKMKVINETLSKLDYLSKQYSDLMLANMQYEKEISRVSGGELHVCAMCHQTLGSTESKIAVIKSYQDKINENLVNASSLKDQIDNLPAPEILKEKYDHLSQEQSLLADKNRSLSKDYNEYQVKIAEAKKDIESAKNTLQYARDCNSQLEEKESQKNELSKSIVKSDYFYRLFSPTGIIVHILSDAIDYINTRLTVYSEVLLEKDYHLDFVKGKMSLVDSRGSSYQSLSNGEKRRLDISIQFALHDYVHMYCGMRLDCCFIDEILDTLDDVGVDNIFDVLRLKLDYCQLKSIYVITHNNALKDKFDQIITVKKELNGDSFLV